METKKKVEDTEIFAIISGVFFVLAAISDAFCLFGRIDVMAFGAMPGIIGLILAAVGILLRIPKMIFAGVIVVLGKTVVLTIGGAIHIFGSVILLLASLTLTMLLAIIIYKKDAFYGIMVKAWFVPFSLLALDVILVVTVDVFSFLSGRFVVFGAFKDIATILTEFLAVLFLSIWLRKNNFDVEKLVVKREVVKKPVMKQTVSTYVQESKSPADILLEYKELLTDGILTQKEFDEIKKRWLPKI